MCLFSLHSSPSLSHLLLPIPFSIFFQYGIPSRVRCDHGGENNAICLFMDVFRGSTQGSASRGRSTHNQRIEGRCLERRNKCLPFLVHISGEQRKNELQQNARLGSSLCLPASDKLRLRTARHIRFLSEVVWHNSCNITLISKVYLGR